MLGLLDTLSPPRSTHAPPPPDPSQVEMLGLDSESTSEAVLNLQIPLLGGVRAVFPPGARIVVGQADGRPVLSSSIATDGALQFDPQPVRTSITAYIAGIGFFADVIGPPQVHPMGLAPPPPRWATSWADGKLR